MTCTKETWLGAYVLDALEPDEAEDVRAHITGCPACQDEVVRLAWIPALLRTVPLEEVDRLDGGAAARDSAAQGLDRLLATARGGDRRPVRRPVAALLGVAAALLAAGAVVAGGGASPGTAGQRPAAVIRTVDPATHVHAAVTLAARSWGTELDLKLSWVPPGERCSLVARARDGRTDVAASWVASYRGTADVPGTTAIPIDQLAELDVVAAGGQRLAQLVVPDGGH